MSERILGAVNALEYKAGEANLEIAQLITVDTDGKAIAAVDGSAPVFPLYTKARAGYTVDIQTAFVAKVRSGAAIAVGDLVTANASSKGVAATTGEYAAGIALTAATGADEFVRVLIVPQVSA